MKNTQKGFIVPLLLSLLAILVIGGGAYAYVQNKNIQKHIAENNAVATSPSVNPIITSISTTTVFADGKTPVFVKGSGFGNATDIYLSDYTQANQGKIKIIPTYIDNNTISFVIPTTIQSDAYTKLGVEVSNDGVNFSYINSLYAGWLTVESVPTNDGSPYIANILFNANIDRPGCSGSDSDSAWCGTLDLFGSGFLSSSSVSLICNGKTQNIKPGSVSKDGSTMSVVIPPVLKPAHRLDDITPDNCLVKVMNGNSVSNIFQININPFIG